MTTNIPIFKTDILVQVSDINYGGHLGNDRFLTLAQEARVRWLRSLGWSELNIADTNAGLVLTEASIKYLKEVFLGEVLVFEIAIVEHSKCSMTLDYKITEKKSLKCVAQITTKIAFFDYKNHKIVKIPQAILDLIEAGSLNE